MALWENRRSKIRLHELLLTLGKFTGSSLSTYCGIRGRVRRESLIRMVEGTESEGRLSELATYFAL
jgi:hypothetical protein